MNSKNYFLVRVCDESAGTQIGNMYVDGVI